MSELRQFSDGYIKVPYEEIFRISEEIRSIIGRISSNLDNIAAAADLTPDWNTDGSDVVRELARADFNSAEDIKTGLNGMYTALQEILSVYYDGERSVEAQVQELPSQIIQ